MEPIIIQIFWKLVAKQTSYFLVQVWKGQKKNPRNIFSILLSGTKTIVSLNCRGLNEAGKREQIAHIMCKHQIDLIAPPKTKVSHSSEEIKQLPPYNDRYLFYFSSSINKTQPNRPLPLPEANAKAKQASQYVEHHGVGFRLISSVKDCVPHSSRLIEIKFHNHGPDLSFINQVDLMKKKRAIGKTYSASFQNILIPIPRISLGMLMLDYMAALLTLKDCV